jgi:hypothetical protein
MKQDIPEQGNLVDYCSNCKKAVIGILIGVGDEYSHTECPECDKPTKSIDISVFIEPLQSQLKEKDLYFNQVDDTWKVICEKLKKELKELREEKDKLKSDKLYWGLEARAKQSEIERLKAGEGERIDEKKAGEGREFASKAEERKHNYLQNQKRGG